MRIRGGLYHFFILGLFMAAACALHASHFFPEKEAFELPKKPREATILFYNVENLFDTINDPLKNDDDFTPLGKYAWRSDRYYQKCRQLAEVISASGDDLPAIIGLAEVENEAVLGDLIAQPSLAAGKYEIVHFPSLDERGIDVALLYRPSIFQPEHIETLFVNLGHENRPTRDILYVKGQLKKGGELHVFVNHWPSRYGGKEASAPKRMAAATVLRRAVDALISRDPNSAIIAMGDFNDYPDDASLTTGLAARGINESGLLVNLMHGTEDSLRGSYNYRGEWGFLDQIIVSRSMHEGGQVMIKPGSAAPFFFQKMMVEDSRNGVMPLRTFRGAEYMEQGYSDHLPVKATIWY